jgi:hypothetical protein
MKKMTEEELIRYLDAEADASYAEDSSNVARDRNRAERDYLRLPYGTEVDGRSQVVSSDVFDAVEGMLPDLLDVFIASDKAVVFDPVSAEDEESAQQVTDACNHVFYKQNNGFLILYSAAKDALMLKTGGVKWWWDVRRTPTFTTYKKVDENTLAQYLIEQPDAEVMSKDEYEPGEEESKREEEQERAQDAQIQQLVAQARAQGREVPPMPPKPPKPVLYTVKIKTVADKGKVCIEPIPPHELEVSRRHASILMDDCPYVAHVARRTLSDIKQMGFDVDAADVRAAATNKGRQDYNYTGTGLRQDALTRDIGNDHTTDESMIRGWLREEYVLVDFDGDGIAERRKIIRLGTKVLLNEEFSHVPIAAWTPYILTHQFVGLSVSDLVTDFQRISTEIWRAQLDNLDMANNQETVVTTDAQGNMLANLDDLLNRRPGGILRETVPNAIRPYQQRWQGIEAMPMLEMLSSAKENRTGWTRYSQGLDANSLNKTATGVTAIMNASQKRMKLMARVMAECLVAPMFRGVFKTLQDYNMEELSFRINGKFVSYDPQNWRDAYDMTINVGIGTGDVLQQAGYLQNIAQAQFATLQTPFGGRIVTEQNFYNVQSRIAENAGFKNPAEFWTDPKNLPPPQPQQPPPDPRVQVEQMRLQDGAQRFQAEQLAEQQKMQMDQQLQIATDQNRQEWEARQKAMEMQQAAQLEALKADHAARQAAAQIEFDRWKVETEQTVKLQIAQMSNDTAAATSQAGAGTSALQSVVQEMASTVQELAAPATIIRDAAGKAIGVKRGSKTQLLVRDGQGRATGLQ